MPTNQSRNASVTLDVAHKAAFSSRGYSMAIMKKKPDIMVLLVMMTFIGVLLTEVLLGRGFILN